jgi:hypothetical protein
MKYAGFLRHDRGVQSRCEFLQKRPFGLVMPVRLLTELRAWPTDA